MNTSISNINKHYNPELTKVNSELSKCKKTPDCKFCCEANYDLLTTKVNPDCENCLSRNIIFFARVIIIEKKNIEIALWKQERLIQLGNDFSLSQFTPEHDVKAYCETCESRSHLNHYKTNTDTVGLCTPCHWDLTYLRNEIEIARRLLVSQITNIYDINNLIFSAYTSV
jgi:hypothetical protein